MPTIAENLGAYASRLRYEDIPPEVIHQVKRTVIDTVGCAFGGYDSEPGKIARELAENVSSSQAATIICSGQKTSADLAIFANGVMLRYLDFNDGYVTKSGGHPSDNLSGLLAVAEFRHAEGRDLIAATVLAHEVFCRICDAWDNKLSGIDHVTIGGIASVTGAAWLMGLTESQTVEAINIMVAGNVALNQIRVGNLSQWKACAYANASRNALFAVQLAARGMTGPSPIFEGRNGFFKIVSGESFELTLGSNSEPFRIMRCHLKQFPLGILAQSIVTAALEARLLVEDIREIADVHVRASKKALSVMADGPEKWRPHTRETADHSIPYTVAVALMYGTIDQTYFDEKYFLHDQALLDLMGRIKCSSLEENAEPGAAIEGWNLCEVEVTLRSGERKSARSEYHRGHWRNPMSDAEVEGKFRLLIANKLPADRVDALLRQLWKLDELADVGTLVELTAAES